MRFLDEYRRPDLMRKMYTKIENSGMRITIMEVCGTHTVNMARTGIRWRVKPWVKLLSGPGCPVCVCTEEDLWMAAEAMRMGLVLATFGDMVRVPFYGTSLEKERARGGRFRVVYSPFDALRLAENSGKDIVFLGVGFETTAPGIALALIEAENRGITNFSVIPLMRLIPPAIKRILERREVKIDGFILPGHVSTIIGSKPYEFIVKEYDKPAVVSGFEPLDILASILYIMRMIEEGKPEILNEYKRVVREEGNLLAKEIMGRVFSICDREWRGLGEIPCSGLELREEYRKYDAVEKFSLGDEVPEYRQRDRVKCRCGDVISGLIEPFECPLFGRICNPSNPMGPCMVSSEGSCAAYYKYGGKMGER